MFHLEHPTTLDIPFWKSLDRHLPEGELRLKIKEKRCYLLKDDGRPVGILRYNLFWDLIPFLNLLYLEEAARGKGFGTQAMLHWESEMRTLGHSLVMTSTLVEETAQHFYRKLGYQDCGCLVQALPPFVDTMEMFMAKPLGGQEE